MPYLKSVATAWSAIVLPLFCCGKRQNMFHQHKPVVHATVQSIFLRCLCSWLIINLKQSVLSFDIYGRPSFLTTKIQKFWWNAKIAEMRFEKLVFEIFEFAANSKFIFAISKINLDLQFLTKKKKKIRIEKFQICLSFLQFFPLFCSLFLTKQAGNVLCRNGEALI
jgi:hypothetical protein